MLQRSNRSKGISRSKLEIKSSHRFTNFLPTDLSFNSYLIIHSEDWFDPFCALSRFVFCMQYLHASMLYPPTFNKLIHSRKLAHRLSLWAIAYRIPKRLPKEGRVRQRSSCSQGVNGRRRMRTSLRNEIHQLAMINKIHQLAIIYLVFQVAMIC